MSIVNLGEMVFSEEIKDRVHVININSKQSKGEHWVFIDIKIRQ